MRVSAQAAALAALSVLLAAAPAGAGNWTLTGTAFERLSVDSNLRLEEDSEGPLIGSTTGLELDLGYDARRTVWALGSGVRLREFVGPGDAGGLGGLSDPRLSGSIVHTGPRQVLEADFRARRQSVAFTRLEEIESGEVLEAEDEDATETRLDLNAGWSRRASPRTTQSLGVDLDLRRFSEESSDLSPSTSFGVQGGWRVALTPRTEAGLTARARRFTSESETRETRSDIVSFGADLATRPTPRHQIALAGSLGRRWTERETEIGPFTVDEDDAGFTFNGTLGWDWTATPRTSVAFDATQGLESTADGDLSNITRIGTTLTRRLTPRSDLALDASFVRRSTEVDLEGDEDDEDDGDSSRFFRLASRLDTDLTRLWDAGLGVELRLRSDDDDSARSAGVFFELRRDLVLNR